MPAYSPDAQNAARRSQLAALLGSAFGAPQGRFGSGLALGVGAGEEAQQRTLAEFIRQQMEQEEMELRRREAEQMMAYRQAQIEEMQRPVAPKPPAIHTFGNEPYAWDEASGSLARVPGPPVPPPKPPGTPEFRSGPNGELLMWNETANAFVPAPGAPAKLPGEPKAPKEDPLWARAVIEAGIQLRAEGGDPATIGERARVIYQSLSGASEQRAIPPLPPGGGMAPVTTETHEQALARLVAAPPDAPFVVPPRQPRRPAPPRLPASAAGDGSARLTQLLAEYPGLNRAIIEKARHDGMTDAEIADLIEQQAAQQGGGGM